MELLNLNEFNRRIESQSLTLKDLQQCGALGTQARLALNTVGSLEVWEAIIISYDEWDDETPLQKAIEIRFGASKVFQLSVDMDNHYVIRRIG